MKLKTLMSMRKVSSTYLTVQAVLSPYKSTKAFYRYVCGILSTKKQISKFRPSIDETKYIRINAEEIFQNVQPHLEYRQGTNIFSLTIENSFLFGQFVKLFECRTVHKFNLRNFNVNHIFSQAVPHNVNIFADKRI